MDYSHDVIVIGAGAAGLTAAGGCAMFGLKAALIEAGEMGGECLNTGCVPSKALIAAAARAQAGRKDRFGVALGGPQVDWSGVHAHIHGSIAAIAPHDSVERFEGMGVEVIRARAQLLGGMKVRAGNRELAAPRIVIATGSKPAIPPIAGIDGVPYLTNETLFDLDELPDHLVIVGAGAIGMEMAQSFRRLGSEVTVIDPGRALGRDDADAAAIVIERLVEEGVRFIGGRADKVEPRDGGIVVTASDGQEIVASHLLIAAGRKANVDGLDLAGVGVETNDNGIVVDARRRTTNKRIYAIGDCRDGPRFTHVSGYEGSQVVLEVAAGVPSKVDYTALPHCTYTDPELAQVGMTEEEARKKHGDAVTVTIEGFDHNDRAVTEGDTAGWVKMVTKGRKVLGVTIVGAHAGEMLLPWSQLITGKASTFALASTIVAYPTLSESSKEAAFKLWEPTVFGKAARTWASLVAKKRRLFG